MLISQLDRPHIGREQIWALIKKGDLDLRELAKWFDENHSALFQAAQWARRELRRQDLKNMLSHCRTVGDHLDRLNEEEVLNAATADDADHEVYLRILINGCLGWLEYQGYTCQDGVARELDARVHDAYDGMYGKTHDDANTEWIKEGGDRLREAAHKVFNEVMLDIGRDMKGV